MKDCAYKFVVKIAASVPSSARFKRHTHTKASPVCAHFSVADAMYRIPTMLNVRR